MAIAVPPSAGSSSSSNKRSGYLPSCLASGYLHCAKHATAHIVHGHVRTNACHCACVLACACMCPVHMQMRMRCRALVRHCTCAWCARCQPPPRSPPHPSSSSPSPSLPPTLPPQRKKAGPTRVPIQRRRPVPAACQRPAKAGPIPTRQVRSCCKMQRWAAAWSMTGQRSVKHSQTASAMRRDLPQLSKPSSLLLLSHFSAMDSSENSARHRTWANRGAAFSHCVLRKTKCSCNCNCRYAAARRNVMMLGAIAESSSMAAVSTHRTGGGTGRRGKATGRGGNGPDHHDC